METALPSKALPTPPASLTLPTSNPLTTAASLAPVIVMVIIFSVPSIDLTVNVSVKVLPTFKA